MRLFGPIALAALTVFVVAPLPAGPESVTPRLPALGNDEAWKRLPREDPPLPSWARVLAGPLPRTTASMLELDRLHRAENPLGTVLAAKLRRVTAEALGCEYARRYAEADLRRAGESDAEIARLAGSSSDVPETERLLLGFATKMARAAETVTDAEVATLLERLGPEKLVAVVHTLAHANFQDRIFQGLGVTVEPGGPLPPLALRFDAEKQKRVSAPARAVVATGAAAPSLAPPRWAARDIAEFRSALQQQKGRTPRIPIPEPGKLAALPPEARARATRIAWSAVSMGYQPRMTGAWFACMDTFQRESNLDPTFANSFFWVITRSNECFY